jgi:hypothetical protein
MTDAFVFLIYSFIITSTIVGIGEIIEAINMKGWTIVSKGKFTLPYKEDEEFEAVIRHCNEKLKEPDKKVYLTMGSDCVYYENCKMSWNWDIVMHRPSKRKKK